MDGEEEEVFKVEREADLEGVMESKSEQRESTCSLKNCNELLYSVMPVVSVCRYTRKQLAV